MSLGTCKFGNALSVAIASSGSSKRCAVSGGCTVPNDSLQQQNGGDFCAVSMRRAENFIAGHAGDGRQNCGESTRSFAVGFGGEMISKSRARVRCQVGGGGSNLTVEDWTKKLPAKRKALYSHSLPCIEAWLQSLGFVQVKEDRSIWNIERPDWHAQLSLDVTDLHIRYLKKGPGNLERDIERKFSYALSREDLENAILGGP